MATVWTGIFIGSAIMFVVGILCGLMVWVYFIMRRNKYHKLIRVTTWTAGKPIVEFGYACIEKHETLGDIYYAPFLKASERHIIPYFGSQYEYPTTKSKIQFVPVTFHNNTYAPESYDPHEEIEKEVFVRKRDEHGNLVRDEKSKKVIFEKVKKKITQFIVKPTKASMRGFNLAQDVAIKDEYTTKPGFWQKYGTLVLGLGIVGFAMVVAIFMIIMAYQWGVDISQNQPEWIAQFMETAKDSLAPPTTE